MDEQKRQLLDESKSLSYSGYSKEEIFTKLGVTDLSPEMRKYVLGVIDEAQVDIEMKKQLKEAGLHKMIIGGFLFVFGLLISFIYYTSNNVAFYIMIGMIIAGPYLAYIGYKEYSTPISEQIRVQRRKITGTKFKKF